MAIDVKPLPGTVPLAVEGDIASQLVTGVDDFLASTARRE